MNANSKPQHRELTGEQQQAIGLLVAGKTETEAAEAVGVNPATVGKWRRFNPWFQAEMNRRRHEIVQATGDRLRALTPKVLDILESELTEGKNRLAAAVQIAKLTRLGDAPSSIGPCDPDYIIDRKVEARLKATQADQQKYLSDTDRMCQSLQPPNRETCEANERAARQAVLDEIENRAG